MRLDAAADALDEVAAAALVEPLQPLGDRFIGVGLELLERQRLHLGHEFVHADPLGERGVDIHRLAGDAAALVRVLMIWSVRMLCSRSASLTSRTRMSSDMASRNLRRFSAARWLSLCASILESLVTPSTRRATFLPNSFLISAGRRQRVLDRVVEDGGDDGLVVEPEVGEDAGDLDRVAVIGVARGPGLAAMRLHREDVGAVDQRLVGVRVIAP